MKRVSQWRSRVDTCICGSSGKGSSGKWSAGSNLKLSPFLTWMLWLMVQLCAAIWSNILKSWQRGAGASSGKRNQVIIRNQISARRGAINTELCFTLHCPLCTWDSLWHRRKARPSPATRDGWAELWVKGRASSSALSAQCGLFTGQDFPLYTPPSFYLPKPKISLCYKLTFVHPWKKPLQHQEDRVCSAWAAAETGGEESRAPRLGPLNVKQRQGQQDKSCNDHCRFPLSLLLLGRLRLFPSEKSL